jgi:TRAP-type C4-dicarboxylate transport system permease large subunit
VVARLTKVPLGTVFRGLTPFWVALCVAILLVITFPQLATWLPGVMR